MTGLHESGWPKVMVRHAWQGTTQDMAGQGMPWAAWQGTWHGTAGQDMTWAAGYGMAWAARHGMTWHGVHHGMNGMEDMAWLGRAW